MRRASAIDIERCEAGGSSLYRRLPAGVFAPIGHRNFDAMSRQLPPPRLPG